MSYATTLTHRECAHVHLLCVNLTGLFKYCVLCMCVCVSKLYRSLYAPTIGALIFIFTLKPWALIVPVLRVRDTTSA